MNQEVRVPQLPESISDATLISWNKSVGDRVAEGDILAELETDKVVLEVPSMTDGFLTEIHAREGQTVSTDELLAVISAEPADNAEPDKTPESLRPPSPAEEKTHFNPSANDPLPPMSPSARRMVKELNIDPRSIRANDGSGPINKSDVIQFLEDQQQAGQVSPDFTPPQVASDEQPMLGGQRVEQRVPMTRLRARIAERLRQAQENAVMLTTFNEIDLTNVIEVRNHYRDDFQQAHGVRLGLMSFFVKAAVEALQRFPIINAAVDGQDIIYHGYYDIGVAVSSDRGLVVPILRDCDQLQMHEIETQIRTFSEKAQDGSLSFEDLNGGTFSITNGGVFGSLLSTPILNPPQSAILGMHKIMQRPVVREDGQIVAAPMMYVALTYDHRIVDGKDAVQFLATIKDAVEEPTRLLLKL